MVIFPYPFWDKLSVAEMHIDNEKEEFHVIYFWSDIFFVFMFLRLIFVFRIFVNYSRYIDAYSKKICKEHGFTGGVRFTLKCFFVLHPERTFLFIFVSSVLIISYITRIFELPYKREGPYTTGNLDNFTNAIWLVIMTITTVGYGDVTPHTNEGKAMACVAALWGAFLVSLLVVTASNVFDLDNN